ncbi:MAG: hypothetical protein B6I36_10970 [Desulfobacteraceae bacterium 4572_35.1]|nr:MAG: hypothetical protein B6I36_10970 [Desulfobacteraceae bacterium 4572_35.1]
MDIDDRINVARNMARRLIKRPKAQGMIGDYGLDSTSATVDDAFVTPEEVRCFSDELRSGGAFYKFLCDHNWPGNMRELNSYVKRYLLAGIHPGANGGAVASSLNLQPGEQGGNFWANLPQETGFETLSDLYLLYQVYIKEIPKDDLATCFNTTIKTVNNRLNAAKKRIKEAAEQYGGVDSFAKQYGFPVDNLEEILK